MALFDGLSDRFWAKVNKNGPVPAHRPELGPCWLWTAGGNGAGYGKLWVTLEGRRRAPYAYQVAWELLVGPRPIGLEPDHLCRVPACVKVVADETGPAHIEYVTHRENVLRGRRGRMVAKCPQGHEYTEANTAITNGRRRCRRCHTDRETERNRAKAAAGIPRKRGAR
jgi:hypothetical protein